MKGGKGDPLAGETYIVQTFAFYVLLLFLLCFFHADQGPRDNESQTSWEIFSKQKLPTG